MKINALSMVLMVGSVSILSACGGGGGSGGEYQAPYNITLRADKTQLPVNIGGVGPGEGVNAPYSTTLYVHATAAEGRPIPNSTTDDTFGCNMAGGLDSGSLYYLDGKDEHEVEVDGPNGEKIKVPGAYRSITLGANSGGNSFHFHASNQAGVARITCSVLDPRDNKYHTASVDITVGGNVAPTGKPSLLRAWVRDGRADLHGILGTQGNHKDRIPNSQVMQVDVMDDTGQPVRGGNVQVRILPGSEAGAGARLVAGGSSSPTGSSALQLPTVQNIATFSLISGAQPGPIFLEYTADRFDNNVANGIQDPVTLIERIDVLEELVAPLVLPDANAEEPDAEGTNTIPFSHLLMAQGGLPPYTWTATGLPKGLSLNPTLGMITGTPDDLAGDYLVFLTVRDKNRLEARGSIRLRLHEAIKPEDFAIAGCTHLANAEDTCHIGTAVTGVPFAYAFTASIHNIEWKFSGLPEWLDERSDEDRGVILGTPITPLCSSEDRNDVGVHRFFVTATKKPDREGSSAIETSVTRPVSISVVRGNGC